LDEPQGPPGELQALLAGPSASQDEPKALPDELPGPESQDALPEQQDGWQPQAAYAPELS
jgi:hypothetical protein